MATTINLDLVEIEGFGPFRDKVEYQLSSEGVRVICGDNMDDPNSQSNGAGKSMLVVAPLWAITGRIDVRGEVKYFGFRHIKIFVEVHIFWLIDTSYSEL